MTFRAYTFTLTDRETADCSASRSSARKLAMRLWSPSGGNRFDRRHTLPADWQTIEPDLGRMPPSPLDRSSSIVRLLLDVGKRSSVNVQPLAEVPADGEPARSAQLLDALLTGLAARPELRLRQEN
jgi:hypothetical protein